MTVYGFDNLDDMLAFMREQEQAANEQVSPEQAQIGYGAFWLRPYGDVLIFGYVPTLEEIEASERELGAEAEELQYTLEVTSDAYERGYRYGQCYSTIEPGGEWGSTHISTMIQISEEQYTQAREHGWSLIQLAQDPVTRAWLQPLLEAAGLL